MLFSQRYHRALQRQQFAVDISPELRRKIWTQLRAHNSSFYVQPDPHDNLHVLTTALEEAESELMTEHGWDRIPDAPRNSGEYMPALRHLVLRGQAEFVLDTIELAFARMLPEDREPFRNKVNAVFELHDCPWRLSDGEFFKLDADFVGARIAVNAHDALAANSFAGAADEYAKARQELAAGDAKDAIIHAGKSFESVMKVLTGMNHANADQLIKSLVNQDYFDDLPAGLRVGFSEQVLKTLPFLRNKLAGHGQWR